MPTKQSISRKHWHWNNKQRQDFPIAKIELTLRDNQVYIGPYLFSPNSLWDRPIEALLRDYGCLPSYSDILFPII